MSKTEGSSWGRINDGQAWGPLVTDLDRAFAKAGLNYYEGILMQYVRERSWTKAVRQKGPGKGRWPDAIPVPWEARRVSEEVGEPRSRMSEARISLLARRMLADTPHGLLINKNAHQWVYPPGHKLAGEPRLDAAALVYARAVQPRPEAPETPIEDGPYPYGNPDETVRKSVPIDAEVGTEIRTDPYGNPDGAVRKTVPSGPEIRTAHYKDRAGGDPTELDPKKTLAESEIAHAGEAGDDEPFLSPGEEPSRPEVRGPGKDSPEAIELERWAAPLGTDSRMCGYGFWARESCEYAPAAWVRSILERKVVGQGRRPGIAVLASILAAWRDAGSPEWAIGPIVAPGASQGPATPFPRRLTPTEQRRAEWKAKMETLKAKEARNGHG